MDKGMRSQTLINELAHIKFIKIINTALFLRFSETSVSATVSWLWGSNFLENFFKLF